MAKSKNSKVKSKQVQSVTKKVSSQGKTVVNSSLGPLVVAKKFMTPEQQQGKSKNLVVKQSSPSQYAQAYKGGLGTSTTNTQSFSEGRSHPSHGQMGFQEYILRSDLYFQSIVDPFKRVGAKIPDDNAMLSGTFQLVERFTLTVANGCAAIALGFSGVQGAIPMGSIIPIKQGVGVVDGGRLGMINDTAITDADLFPSGAGRSIPISWSQMNFNNGVTGGIIPNAYNNVRLVSMGVVANYLGAALAAKGRLISTVTPRNYFRPLLSIGPVTTDMVLQTPGSRVIPINQLKTITSTYRPMDGRSLIYGLLDQNTVHTVNSVQEWETQYPEYCGQEMIVLASGATNGDTLQVTVVGNFEGIPSNNTVDLISSSPSPVSADLLSNAMEKSMEVPQVTESSDFRKSLNYTANSYSDFHSGEHSELRFINLDDHNGRIHSLTFPMSVIEDKNSTNGFKLYKGISCKPSEVGGVKATQPKKLKQDKNFIDKINEYLSSGETTIKSLKKMAGDISPLNEEGIASILALL
jgi:hypothetical protein